MRNLSPPTDEDIAAMEGHVDACSDRRIMLSVSDERYAEHVPRLIATLRSERAENARLRTLLEEISRNTDRGAPLTTWVHQRIREALDGTP